MKGKRIRRNNGNGNGDDHGPDARARASDPPTSHKAARRMSMTLTKSRKRVIDAMEEMAQQPQEQGMERVVSLEVSRFVQKREPELIWSVSPRFVELEDMGLVVRDGTKLVQNSTGHMRNLQAWRLAR